MASGTGFSGHLSIVSLREVLKKLHVAGETGKLSLFTPMARATVWLQDGEVVCAEVGGRAGEAALDVLSVLTDGTFTFASEAPPVQGTPIAARVLAENWAAKEPKVTALMTELPSLIDAVQWSSGVLDQLLAEKPEQERLIGALRARETLLEALIDVDVDLIVALELFQQATIAQKKLKSSVRSGDGRSSFTGGDATFGSNSGSGPEQGAIVGVRPRRTVLGADKRSLAFSSGLSPEPPWEPATSGTQPSGGENLGARTIVGVPLASLGAGQGSPLDASPNGSAKRRGLRTSSPTVPAAETSADPVEVGDVLELVPETVRHVEPAQLPSPLPEKSSSKPPPSSVGGSNSVVLAGKRLVQLASLSEASRFAVQLVADANKSDGSEMALKMPRRPDESANTALEWETSVLAAVSHPNLVRLAHAGVDVETPFLLTWYWPGVTLSELIALNKPLPEGLVVSVVRQVLEASSALHDPTNPRGGVVHCNLCPENVLLGLDGVVRVCGLSNARPLRSKINDEDLAVHAQYAAPELLRGQRVDERSDVYSAGMLLRLALRHETGQDARRLGELRALVARATDVTPGRRYAKARDFGLALDALPEVWKPRQVGEWLAKEMAALKLEAARSTSPSSPKKRPKILAALAVVLVLIVAILAWMFKK